MALRRSHFQYGNMQGEGHLRVPQPEGPPPAPPPSWARKEFCVVVCTALLTFVCMLRYWMWNVVPIWFLYSSIFMVIHWADLVPVFFDTYRNILCQSNISGQDAQSASIPRMFFPVGWKRQPEEGGIGPGCCGGGVINTWLRETALLRQGLLSEPQASSGPAAMLLAVSRSPSSIPRRSPCPERCHLPLASLSIPTKKTAPGSSNTARHRNQNTRQTDLYNI